MRDAGTCRSHSQCDTSSDELLGHSGSINPARLNAPLDLPIDFSTLARDGMRMLPSLERITCRYYYEYTLLQVLSDSHMCANRQICFWISFNSVAF
jgi:hypothetical protein